MNSLDLRQLHIHVRIVGFLMISYGVMLLVFAGFVLIVLVGIEVAVQDPKSMLIISILMASACLFLFLFAITALVGGIGVFFHKPWTRLLGIVSSFITLISFPIGTMIGAYSLLVLFQDEAKEYFKGLKTG